MFETLSWFYRYIFVFFILSFFILSCLIFFHKKNFLQPFLPVLIILMNATSYTLFSMINESIEYKTLFVSLTFCIVYIITRISLNKILKINDFLIYDIVCMLLSIGIIMLYRLNPDYAIRQMIFMMLGSILYFFIFGIFKRIKLDVRYAKYIGLSILVILIITQVYGIQVFGSKNWIQISNFRFQPSEFLKILFVIYISMLLSNGLDKKIFLYLSLSIIIITLFFAMQRDLGSALIFFAVYLIMLFTVDKRIYFTLISSATAFIMAVMSFYTFYHVRSRVEAWLYPWKFISDKSYQVTQSLFAVASGGLLGTGLFLGSPNFIPAVHTDFIFSAISEETGIISAIIILLLLGLLTLIGIRISLFCNDNINKLICVGLTSITAIQTLIIICGVLNIIPITGVTLPFISYGGSSLLSQIINISILYYINSKETSEKNV